MELDEALDEREPQPRARGASGLPAPLVETAENLLLLVRRDAEAGVGHPKLDLASVAAGAQGDRAAGGDELHRVAQQVEENLLDAALVGLDVADVGRTVELDAQVLPEGALARELKHAGQGRVQIEASQLERHAAGIDGGEVEDVIDQVEQVVRGTDDAVRVLFLALIQRAEILVGQNLGEPDDGGERRPELIRDVGEEFGRQPVRGLERLGALAKRALDADAVGDVEVGVEHVAVGERHAGIVDHQAVGPLEPLDPRPAVGGAGDGPRHVPVPVAAKIDQGLDEFDELADMGFARQHFLVELPDTGVARVVELQPSVGAEDGDALVQVVQRRPLHGDQGVARPLQLEPVGDVLEKEQQTAEGMTADAHPERGAVGQMTELLQRLDERGIEIQALFLEGREVGHLGQAAPLMQQVQGFALRGFGGEPVLVEPPHPGEGGVEELETCVGSVDDNSGCQALEHLRVGLDVTAKLGPGLVPVRRRLGRRRLGRCRLGRCRRERLGFRPFRRDVVEPEDMRPRPAGGGARLGAGGGQGASAVRRLEREGEGRALGAQAGDGPVKPCEPVRLEMGFEIREARERLRRRPEPGGEPLGAGLAAVGVPDIEAVGRCGEQDLETVEIARRRLRFGACRGPPAPQRPCGDCQGEARDRGDRGDQWGGGGGALRRPGGGRRGHGRGGGGKIDPPDTHKDIAPPQSSDR